MKTTVEIPDDIYRQIKAYSALQGRTFKEFLNEALREKLSDEPNGRSKGLQGWRSVFGVAPKDAMEEVQKVIDQEFSKIDLESWR